MLGNFIFSEKNQDSIIIRKDNLRQLLLLNHYDERLFSRERIIFLTGKSPINISNSSDIEHLILSEWLCPIESNEGNNIRPFFITDYYA